MDGARASLQPLLESEAILHVAANEHLVAVSVGTLDAATLYVGKPTTSGPLELTPVDGADRLPSWAAVRVGTDAEGDPVVGYPSCGDERIASCVATQWSARTREATPVGGFDDAGGAMEVAVDLGNAAIIATNDAQITADGLRNGGWPKRTVWTRRGAGEAQRLKLADPRTIALHGDTLGVIHPAAEDGGICGRDRAELRQLDAPDAKPRVLGETTCGLGGTRMVSIQLWPTRARVMVTANGEDGHPEFFDHDGATGKTTRHPLGADVSDVAWISRAQAFAVSPVSTACADGLYDTSGNPNPPLDPCYLGRITRKAGAS